MSNLVTWERQVSRFWILSVLLAAGWQGQGLRADEVVPGSQTAKQLVVKTTSGDEIRETTVRYWLFLPATYSEKEPVPLMLFLHGAGERGDNLDLVKKWGPPKLVEKDNRFPFLVVSPQCPQGKRWDVEQMVALVKHVAEIYRVDQSRMYCSGLSMGGHGTWAIVAKYPKLFAAAVPICGGGDPKKAKALATVPIWAFHGDKDKAVPLKRSEEMVAAIKEAGGDARLTVYPDVGHNSWSATYANKKVYQWLLSKQLNLRP